MPQARGHEKQGKRSLRLLICGFLDKFKKKVTPQEELNKRGNRKGMYISSSNDLLLIGNAVSNNPLTEPKPPPSEEAGALQDSSFRNSSLSVFNTASNTHLSTDPERFTEKGKKQDFRRSFVDAAPP